jgi:alkaline phosphatase D
MCRPWGARSRVYRELSYGPLASFIVLDGRQYRSDQACGDSTQPPCPAMYDETRTMLGREQERWLADRFRRSRAGWNILANQTRVAKVDAAAGPEELYAMDAWAGYDAARRRLVQEIVESRLPNPVVITGDIHTNWVCDVKVDYKDEKSPVAAAELIGTSISSGGDGADGNPSVDRYLSENPQIKFFNGQRGYVRCEVTPDKLTADFRVVEKVSTPQSTVSTRATFVVEAGKAGANRA